MIRIALLGAGLIGREHGRRIQAQAQCALHSVVDPSEAGRDFAAAMDVPLHSALEQLLAGPLPDAALIATPNALHGPQALALLRRGVPVLIEKPITDTLEAAQDLVRAVRQSGVPVLVGHHRRHGAILRAAHAHIASGALGRLVALNASVLFHKPDDYFAAAPWRTQPGGGPVLINLVHEIDTLRHLAGEINAVQATTSNATRGHEVEDSAAVLLEFSNGALGTLILSDCAAATRSWEQTAGENPAYARDTTQDCLFIAGTRGSIAVPTLHTWHASDAAPSWTKPMSTRQLPLEDADPLINQLDHFCDVVRGRSLPLISAEDALGTLQATLAVQRAAQTRARVALR